MIRTRKEVRKREEGEEEKEDAEFALDTTGDPALQEDFLPFGNEYDYNEDEDEGSISDVQEFLG